MAVTTHDNQEVTTHDTESSEHAGQPITEPTQQNPNTDPSQDAEYDEFDAELERALEIHQESRPTFSNYRYSS